MSKLYNSEVTDPIPGSFILSFTFADIKEQ